MGQETDVNISEFEPDYRLEIENAGSVVNGDYDGGNWISTELSGQEIDRLRAAVRNYGPNITPKIAADLGLGNKQNKVAEALKKWRL